MTDTRIIVALDYSDAREALEFVNSVDPARCRVKVGKELFTRAGPMLVEHLVADGFDVFLDLKYHDIPQTVARACAAAAELGVWMLNVHALGGRRMMQAAREAVDGSSTRPLLIAVTVLTSMDHQDLTEVGLDGTPEDNVLRLATLARESGMDGVVCSGREAARLRVSQGSDFILVTPGIRPMQYAQADQKRVMSPAEAIRCGSDFLVIGRPITAADDPVSALLTIESEISSVMR